MSYATGTIIVGTTATLIKDVNLDRIKITLKNVSTEVVYIGDDNAVTSTTGFPIIANAEFEDTATVTAWYGITGTSSSNVSYEEQDIVGVN